jgi:hypothetical protein
LRTRRWHGIATATAFEAQARATARTAFGKPMCSASVVLKTGAAHIERQIEP